MNEINPTLAQAQRVEQRHPWGRAVWHVWGRNEPTHAQRTPLVLLHGGSGSWTHWLRNVAHLAKTHEVWALDIPGFGDSDLPPSARDADDLVPYVETILQMQFGDAALDVIGFSFGGMLAGMIAAHQPARWRTLILVGVPGLGLFGKDLPMRGMRANMSQAEQRDVHRDNLRVMMLSDACVVDDALIDLQQNNVARDRLRRRRIARTDVLLPLQNKWTCAVHGIWGERDALYRDTLAQVPKVLHRLQSFHVIPTAGHWVQYEAPEAFHAYVDQILNNSRSPNSVK